MNGNVIWKEGMVLSPHHFQRNDLYFESLLKNLVNALGVNRSGFFHLTFDDSSLQSGIVALSEAKGIFPDGKFFSLDSHNEQIPPKNFLEYFSPSTQKLEVFLGLPKAIEGASNISKNSNTSSAYLESQDSFVDFRSGENPQEIAWAKDNLQLLVSGESTGNYTLLKVGEIIKDQYENFCWDESQGPTILQIRASFPLVSALQKLNDRLLQKATHIQGKGLEVHADNLPELLLYQSIIPAQQYLSHILMQSDVHPENVFLQLLQLRSSLSVQQSALQGGLPPIYEHANNVRSLFHIISEIEENLEAKSSARYEIIPMEKSSLVFGTTTDNISFDSLSEVIIAFASPLNPDQLVQYLPRMVKIAPKSKLQAMVSSAVRGLDIEPVSDLPSMVRPKDGYVYFRIDRHNILWEEVIQENAIALYGPQNLSLNEVELLCVYA